MTVTLTIPRLRRNARHHKSGLITTGWRLQESKRSTCDRWLTNGVEHVGDDWITYVAIDLTRLDPDLKVIFVELNRIAAQSVIIRHGDLTTDCHNVDSNLVIVGELGDREILSSLVVRSKSWQVCHCDSLCVPTRLSLLEIVGTTSRTYVSNEGLYL